MIRRKGFMIHFSGDDDLMSTLVPHIYIFFSFQGKVELQPVCDIPGSMTRRPYVLLEVAGLDSNKPVHCKAGRLETIGFAFIIFFTGLHKILLKKSIHKIKKNAVTQPT